MLMRPLYHFKLLVLIIRLVSTYLVHLIAIYRLYAGRLPGHLHNAEHLICVLSMYKVCISHLTMYIYIYLLYMLTGLQA